MLVPLSVGGAAEAGGVNESGLVRQAVPVGDNGLPGYRLAGGAVPLLPFFGTVWLPVALAGLRALTLKKRIDCACFLGSSTSLGRPQVALLPVWVFVAIPGEHVGVGLRLSG